MTPLNSAAEASELVLLRSKVLELETRLERVRLEKKLATAGYNKMSDRDRLRLFIDSNIVAVHRADIFGHVTEANDAAIELVGYSREELFTGKVLWMDFTLQEDLHHDQRAIEQLKLNGRSGWYQKEYIHKNGTHVPVLMQVTAINENATDCLSVIIDLTEDVKIERQLRESEAQFRMLAEAVPHIVWMCDPSGRIIYANQRWFDFTGMTRADDADGKSWMTVLHPDDRRACMEAAEQAFHSDTDFNMEIRYRAANGSYRWHLVRAQTIIDPKTSRKLWFGTSTDIDDKKRATEEIKESEMRFRMLADAIPQIVFTANADGEIDYFNERWFEYTGLSLAQSQNDGWQLLIHPDDLPNYMIQWRQALASGDSHEIEFRLRRAVGIKTPKNKVYRWHLGRAVALRGTDGSVIKWFATWTEIEDQRDFRQ
ncbi:MAG TPA: PAS domain-containing protein [Drouetiella sp.]